MIFSLIRNRSLCPILLLTLFLSSPAPADKLFLNNGEMLEGIVTDENTSSVVLDLGAGSTTISRSKVKSIERAGEDANNLLRAQWQKDHYLNRENVPQGLEPVAEGFKNLSAVRASLIQAIKTGSSADADTVRIRDEIAVLQKKMLGLTLRLKSTPANDATAYNAIVLDHNATSAELALKHHELDKIRKAHNNLAGRMATYLDLLASYRSEFNSKLEKYKKEQQDSTKTHLFETIAGKLTEFEKEYTEYSVPVTASGDSVVVVAIANNNVSGKFTIDTGASMVTLSQAFARRASLTSTNTGKYEIFLADGSKRTVPSVTMDSFQVGNAKVGKLEAVVVPSVPGGGTDGLIGMNFLQHFQMHMDAANGKLTLRQLKTE